MKLLYGLVGRSLGHSYSPLIHQKLGNDDYRLFELEPEELEGFLAREDIGGLNVTIPYKRTVMAYCDELSPMARSIGSVNTLLRREGKLWGYNTDAYGFEYMLRRGGISPAGKKVLILGSGGASLTAKTVLRDMGAAEIVTISRRGPETYEGLPRHRDGELIVNATPLGMYPHNLQAPLSLKNFPRCVGLLDLIYNPHRTALMMEAETLGIPCVGGLSMLVAQARGAAELFFRTSFPDALPEAILSELHIASENILLIGMPGSGKSSIGKALARLSGRECVDIDDLIVKEEGRSIPQIFAQEGEEAFRTLEKETLLRECKEGGRIIVTGGGVVLDPDNYPPLHQNGKIYHISRAVELLATQGRPLSTDGKALRDMEARRLPLYERFRDVEIYNEDIDAAAERIWRDFNENTRP